MKKILSAILAGVMILNLSACSGDNNTSSGDGSDKHNSSDSPDLSGQWKQVNSNSEDSYQGAIIQDDVIEIYWVSNGGDTRSLYWSGTFDAPDTTDEPYVWESENNKARTSSSIMSSSDDTKTFTYEDGQITYSSSIMGTTTKVRLEKEEWEPGLEVVKIEPLDLSGQWKQVNSDSEEMYLGAVISGNTIEIYNVYDDNSRQLYWSGSFSTPDVVEGPYLWSSRNNIEKTNLSLLASRDNTKEFIFEDDKIIFPLIQGDDFLNVEMVKEGWAPDLGAGEFDAVTYSHFSVAGMEFSLPSYYEKNLELSESTETWFTSIFGGMLCFIETNAPGTQKEFDESIDDITLSLAGKSQEEIEYSEDISLAGLSARFIIFPNSNNELTVYMAFTYNEHEEKLLTIMFFSPLPTSEKNYSIYFNHILDSAKLIVDSKDSPEDSHNSASEQPEDNAPTNESTSEQFDIDKDLVITMCEKDNEYTSMYNIVFTEYDENGVPINFYAFDSYDGCINPRAMGKNFNAIGDLPSWFYVGATVHVKANLSGNGLSTLNCSVTPS